MEGRPDESDFEVAKAYTKATYKRFTDENDRILGELEKTEHTEEQLDSIETFRFNVLTQLPTRGGEECSMCMICEELCPTGAMEAESGEADKGKCIACLACVANCPESVLKINDMSNSWSFKLEMEKTTEASIKRKKSKIYL
jgi:ferredoxin